MSAALPIREDLSPSELRALARRESKGRVAARMTNPAHAWVPAAASNTSYTANALNQYTAVGPLVPAYDGNGNLTSDGITSYGYDVENRLVSVNRAGMTAGYTYDVLGRRHSKTVNGVTTVFLHDGDREIAELDTGGAILRRYVHAAGLDEVIATLEADGTQRFLHRDTLGSVVAVTDAGGAVVERHAYGPFGESAVLTGTPWRFAGQRLDPESGLYYMRGRHYNPMLGRFVQPDPIGYEGGLNLYAYVNNDPINLADPMGTEPVNKAGIMAALLDGQQNARNNPINANTGATQVADASAVMAMGGRAIGTAASASPLGAAVMATMMVLTPTPVADGTCASGGCTAPVPNGPSILSAKTPNSGEPGTWVKNPGSGQERLYGSDRKPEADIDWDHDHGQGSPHAHNWGRKPDGTPVRDTGVPVSPWPKDRTQ